MSKQINITGRETRAPLTARQRANLELLLLEIEIDMNVKQREKGAAAAGSGAPGCAVPGEKVLCRA